jgi:hypothetical protein
MQKNGSALSIKKNKKDEIMAFAFVVEDGTGLPNATSYVSLSEANDILVTNIHNTAWEALNDTSKQYLLAWATSLLDTKADWDGQKAYPTSALRWPRKYTVDRDNVTIPSNVVPKQLKQATAQYARFLIENDRTVEQETDGLTKIVVDVIELEFDKSYRLAEVPSYINDLIFGIGRIKGGATTVAKIRRS